jgi:hypothetical protein
MPVPGTTTPDDDPFEQVTLAQPPPASIAAMCVVEPSRDSSWPATDASASFAKKRSR